MLSSDHCQYYTVPAFVMAVDIETSGDHISPWLDRYTEIKTKIVGHNANYGAV